LNRPSFRSPTTVATRLANETSAYLRSATHQPVDWYPWGEEAFAKAKADDKPILLDIGAVWCHWCHVIDHESYEDPEIAKIINERFVPVKVDRDERPDVDSRYQSAVNAISGQGGWPLTAFLTPDGKVFYGGTYFPPRDLHGRPSFRRILLAVSDHYTKERADAINTAESLHQALAERRGLHLKLVALELCTDNAAMIAAAARFVESAPYPEYLDWDVSDSGIEPNGEATGR